ncbi:MAG: 2,3,4,5-tetrahydropyridine-2,6-dicarboxylate N-succinyltransferase [Sphingomonadaceae bacterium]|uniref:2,3,4,5-tetrahydropyridine-2,6-dicarboxylate N-succinyltransferase n=1 Tax=Thermaurantiacus sp. TaxID=2820283 RepID=UPI00298EE59B|nr:2,3,4,5-tetrahydropyridine-2,6-dicarboxylate N-succinyltransferase [Thermaurantiacus sp.]MCS6987396.1 2,3,4,5-tetrahydropyridine-2,6-dicarboxylate N-succinyltransferase [Sphingomonadaceae bacterium]MDW8415316.1 2,3,4,5-tetrahydropyridine-2,6-dicarboxylate N-succinyltransferase [Thermaurantiacus sp.]
MRWDPPSLRQTIERAWAQREGLSPATGGEIRAAVETVIEALDEGRLRVAEPGPDGHWIVHEWIKKAVLLSFRLEGAAVMPGGVAPAFDKVPLKTQGWDASRFARAGFRMVPGAIVRRGAYVAPGAVLMPCFVNVGARVGEGTMIDTWATVGSCAQVGARCHISGGAGIGGVLEPLQAAPVILEDGVFVGARAEVAEGVIVRQGAVIAMGVFLGASTRIVDRATGEVRMGEVPPYAVVVPGSLPDPGGGPALACAVIVKRVDARTRAKTTINELLRD